MRAGRPKPAARLRDRSALVSAHQQEGKSIRPAGVDSVSEAGRPDARQASPYA